MSGPRFYLYGRGEPAVWALLRDPAFGRLVRRLIAEGPVPREAAGGVAESTLRDAAGCGLVDLAGGAVAAGERLVLIPAAASAAVEERLEPHLRRYAETAAAVIEELRGAWAVCRAAERFAWPEVAHAVVAGMLLDLSVGTRLWRSGVVERAYWDTVVWAFERVAARNPFGVQWVAAADGERCGFAQLWHAAVERPDLDLYGAAVGALRRIAEEEAPAVAPRELLYLRYLGLARGAGSELRPQVPVLHAEEMDERLLPILWRGAEDLVARAVTPALTDAVQVPWWRRRRDLDPVHHALVRLLLELGVDRVVEAGVLAPFPQGAPPAAWGRWLWCEGGGERQLVGGAFAAAPTAGEAPRELGAAAGGRR